MVIKVEMRAIQELYEKLKDEPYIEKRCYFGSKARGEETEYSDVDLLILTKTGKSEISPKIDMINGELSSFIGTARIRSFLGHS